jgi:hypothetical protein
MLFGLLAFINEFGVASDDWMKLGHVIGTSGEWWGQVWLLRDVCKML